MLDFVENPRRKQRLQRNAQIKNHYIKPPRNAPSHSRHRALNMNAGTLCLAADSVIRELRHLNMRVLRLQQCVDFNDPLPDLDALRDTLGVIKSTLNLLIDCATDKASSADDEVDNLISSPIRNELELMMQLYTANGKADDDEFPCLKLCSYMLKHLKYLQLKYYLRYVKLCHNDHVKTFTHVVNIFVLPSNKHYDHIVYQLRLMVELCNQIAVRLAAFRDDNAGNDNLNTIS
ncbi:agip136 [Agrotis ipsilon multiple nucleopolyhedrovirus]|uniref:Uncharacterized protein n=1 Tax=Agrotis ipsilon multiple nucleopolyhedrovirus TaxID=208013 RepID=B6D650_9ABAC|nr:agip136 [Agrotis ipsilon multiple nucleopolyhedrovirus]ACI28837.1 unknown [Agrotis ipsilon multiple nucleopolyhedrovirus]